MAMNFQYYVKHYKIASKAGFVCFIATDQYCCTINRLLSTKEKLKGFPVVFCHNKYHSKYWYCNLKVM